MRARKLLLTTAAVLPGVLASAPLAAQSITLDPPPVRQPLDENGVDLSSGQIVVPSSSVAIGGRDGLVHTRYRVANGWRHNYILAISSEPLVIGVSRTVTVSIGGASYKFVGPVYSGGDAELQSLPGCGRDPHRGCERVHLLAGRW